MAAAHTLVDLHMVAAGTKLPYSTLARWASQDSWPVLAKRGCQRLYSYEHACDAVTERLKQRAA